MNRAKLTGNVTSVNIADIKEDLLKAIEKGYSVKSLLKIGIKVALSQEELVKNLIESLEKLEKFKRDLEGLSQILGLVSSYSPVLANMQSELKSLIVEIQKARADANNVIDQYKKSVGYVEDLKTDLKKMLEKYKLSMLDEMLNKLNEIDKLRISLAQTFNIPSDYKDLQEMALKIAQLKQLISKLKESS